MAISQQKNIQQKHTVTNFERDGGTFLVKKVSSVAKTKRGVSIVHSNVTAVKVREER